MIGQYVRIYYIVRISLLSIVSCAKNFLSLGRFGLIVCILTWLENHDFRGGAIARKCCSFLMIRGNIDDIIGDKVEVDT